MTCVRPEGLPPVSFCNWLTMPFESISLRHYMQAIDDPAGPQRGQIDRLARTPGSRLCLRCEAGVLLYLRAESATA